MKILVSFYLLTLCNIIFGQNNATKEETVSWLSSRLKYVKQWEEKTYASLEIIKYDFINDTMFYKVQYTWSDENGGRIESIPIREINPNRLKIVRMIGNEGDLGIELYTNYGKETIKQLLKGSSDGKGIYLDQNKITLYFPKAKLEYDGYDLPQRTVEALKHLIMLAGGKGEKF